MAERKKYIVVDLDGTLCDCAHRVAHAQAGDWDKFHDELINDKPNPDVAWALEMLVAGCSTHNEQVEVIALSGRNDSAELATYAWLEKHRLLALIDYVILRPSGNFESDHTLKPRLLAKHFFDNDIELMKKRVLFVLDDRDKVVAAWRDLGINCWQVRNGQY